MKGQGRGGGGGEVLDGKGGKAGVPAKPNAIHTVDRGHG